MKYMGSKNRFAKYILPIILDKRESLDQLYVEPFVGGANIIDKVHGKRLGIDNNEYLIEMWKKVSNGWIPPQDLTELQYNDIRVNKEKYPKELVAYCGFALSYAGKWFGGWCRDSQGKRNYVKEAYNNALKQFPKLKDVDFICSDYKDLIIPENSIIYCDPPYEGTTSYNTKFDHDIFWEWCRTKKKEGHIIFISEYNAPEDFKCIWEKNTTSSLTKDTGSKRSTEKLFTL